MNRIFSLIILTLLLQQTHAQDTLPDFKLIERGNRVIISWVNPYQSVIQLNVQRSYDSLTNFKTIFSAPSPQLPQNGFSEVKPPTNRVFYRIFYVLQGGSYFFSKSRKLGDGPPRRNDPSISNVGGGYKGIITVNLGDSFYTKMLLVRYRSFRDSILHFTKDTLTAINDSLVAIHPYVGPEIYRPSVYVYSNRYGITISLPAAGTRRYRIKFFEEDGSPLFEIANVKDPQLTLDKSNFLHAGWFLFELYEDERLKEKNKLYLSKDF